MSATFTDTLKIYDDKGFHFEVSVRHHPELGTSIAYYREMRVDQFEYGRYLLPRGDDDGEWESFEERFREGAGGDALSHFEISCKEYIQSLTR